MSVAQEIQRLKSAKANIKTAIENKGVTVGDGTIDTYAEKISQISGGGGVDVTSFIKVVQLQSLNGFGTKEVVVNLPNVINLNAFCFIETVDDINTTVEHITINAPKPVSSVQNMLYSQAICDDTVLKKATLNINMGSATNCTNLAGGRRGLEIIDGEPLNFSGVTLSSINPFQRCYELREVRFCEGSIFKSLTFTNCEKLSTNTIQSIFNGLATVGTTQTLTFHSNLKILQSQVDDANAKGWTVAGGKVVSEEEYYA